MLCDTFKTLAHSTWNKIDYSRRAGFQLKEETFTDINLLDLKSLHTTEIVTYEYNKKQEGFTGADWEWWFTNKHDKWVGFRVQAKIINIFSEEFEHLHYCDSSGVYQCEKLILRSHGSDGIMRIPLYCLYLQSNLLKDKPKFCPAQLFGCSLLSPYKVRQLRKRNLTHISDFEDYLFPWHELVCFDKLKGLVEHVGNYSRKNFVPEQLTNSVFIYEEPPPYVSLAMETRGQINNPEVTNYQGLAGIVIITSEE